MKKKLKISILEYVVLSGVLLMVVIGIISFQVNKDWFLNTYIVEDGLIENLTLVPLLIAAVTALVFRQKFAGGKSKYFKTTMILIAFSCVFVAGEEISWGQRIFNVQSNGFFIENNAQLETNIHNLVVGDVKINKLIFSKFLYLGVGIYLTVLPYYYRKNSSVKIFADYYGIPIPQFYQTLSCLILLFSIPLIPHGKNSEILEVGISYIFLLILLFPRNNHIFRRLQSGY